MDRRLSEQLAARAELESLNVVCEGLAAQVTDAQHKLDAVNAARVQLEPAIERLAVLQQDLEHTRVALQALQRDDDTLAAQDRRLTELSEASRALSLEAAQRLETVQGFLESWSRPVRSGSNSSASSRKSRNSSATRSRRSRLPTINSIASTRCVRSSISDGPSWPRRSRRYARWTAE